MVSRSTEIRHLQALCTLAQELHFGRAAQRLNITQPALSKALHDLEAKLGFRVLERTTRKVILTPAGRMFLREAEAILLRLETAIEQSRAEAGQSNDKIRIGVILPMMFDFLPSILTSFRHRYPKVQIHIENRESLQLAAAVESGSLHVALISPPKQTGLLRMETVRQDSFVVAMRDDHKLAAHKTLQLAQLVGANVLRILSAGMHESFDAVDLHMRRAGIDLDRCQITETPLTALALIAAGNFVSLVPSWLTGMPWAGLRFLPLSDVSTQIDLAIAWEASIPIPTVQHFIETARKISKRKAN